MSLVCAFSSYLVWVVLHTASDEDEGVVHRRQPSREVGYPHPHGGEEYDCHIGGNTLLSQSVRQYFPLIQHVSGKYYFHSEEIQFSAR